MQTKVKKVNNKENKKPKLQSKMQTVDIGGARDRSLSQGAKLSELCPEDKAKIGELVKKLALESKQKKEYLTKFQSEKEEMARRLKELEQQSVIYEDERDQMKDKFTQSLSMLKLLKEEQQKVDEDRKKREEELKKVKEELERREEEWKLQRSQLEQEREEKQKQLL